MQSPAFGGLHAFGAIIVKKCVDNRVYAADFKHFCGACVKTPQAAHFPGGRDAFVPQKEKLRLPNGKKYGIIFAVL